MKLEVDSLSKHFGGVRALTEVSLEVREQQIVGIIGPNGSGKTTLLNVVSGVYAPSSGAARLDGTVVTARRPDQVARLGIARTFQNIRVFRELTLVENIRVAAGRGRGLRAADQMARRLIAEFELERWAGMLAGTLPYGIQRRLEIVRALALEPRVLLLDEPGAGLNDAESEELTRLIRRLLDEHGCSLLVIDHDMRMMLDVCHRVVVLNEGRKIADGPPAVVRHDPTVIEAYLG